MSSLPSDLNRISREQARISMTPDEGVSWNMHRLEQGRVVLPDDATDEHVDILLSGSKGLEFINSGAHANVYRAGTTALKVGSDTDLDWHMANITLSEALRISPQTLTTSSDGRPRVVRTPKYLGFFVPKFGLSRALMSDESVGREHLSVNMYIEIMEELALVCSQALADVFPGCEKIILDTIRTNNAFVGITDVVKIDARPPGATW